MKLTLPCLVFFAAAASGATLAHDFNLTSSLNDLVGSDNLVSDGGAVTASGYSFQADQGLHVSSALSNTSDYSILIDFSFSDLNGYKKILDYVDRTSDDGLYTLNPVLDFYPAAAGPSAFAVNTFARVILTRDSTTSAVSGYVNGAQQFSFTDSSSIAVFSSTNGLIRFFEDDFVTGQREATPGVASRISIYNGALSATDALALGGPSLPASNTPEPTSVMTLSGGLLSFAVLAVKRGFRRA